MEDITRRGFLHKSTAAAASCTIPLKAGDAPSLQAGDKPRVRRYKTFGKTGWKVADISAGALQGEPALVEYQFQRGINLFDTAFEYPGHEELLGRVLPKWRDKVFVIDKWQPELTTATVTKAKLLEQLDVCLGRLNTDYVDCMMLQAIGRPELGDITRVQNPAIYEAYDEAKRQGKIRFTGASGCGPKVLEEMEWGIDHDRFDVILCGSNFLTRGLERVVKKARAKGVATMAMKTMTIFKSDLNIRDLVNRQTNARQAVIKYVLASDLFDTMIISMRNYQMVDDYLAVSGTTSLKSEDDELLEFLGAAVGTRYCRPGCDECFGSCPREVPIWDILRYKMYFENYGDQKHAMVRYGRIPDSMKPLNCAGCDAPCERACSFKVDIRSCLIEAHKMLSMT
jgi:predicted aldo/keto reductase-like oxidoreductase